MATNTAPSTALPNELLLEIASYLPFSSLVRIKNCSRRWRDIVAETKLEPGTRKLFDAYNCIVTIPSLQRSPSSVPGLTEEQRAQYAKAIGDVAGQRRGEISEQESQALSIFLMWVKEWPSHAAVRGFSPAAVIGSYLDGSSHNYSHGELDNSPVRDYLLFSHPFSEFESPIMMLKLMHLRYTQDRKLRCVPRAPPEDPLVEFWHSIFIPLLPLQDTSTTTAAGLVTHFAVLMGPETGPWTQLPYTMTTIDSEGYYDWVTVDLAEFIVKQAAATGDALWRQACTVQDAARAFQLEHRHTTNMKTGRPLPTPITRNTRTAHGASQASAPSSSSTSRSPEGGAVEHGLHAHDASQASAPSSSSTSRSPEGGAAEHGPHGADLANLRDSSRESRDQLDIVAELDRQLHSLHHSSSWTSEDWEQEDVGYSPVVIWVVRLAMSILVLMIMRGLGSGREEDGQWVACHSVRGHLLYAGTCVDPEFGGF